MRDVCIYAKNYSIQEELLGLAVDLEGNYTGFNKEYWENIKRYLKDGTSGPGDQKLKRNKNEFSSRKERRSK